MRRVAPGLKPVVYGRWPEARGLKFMAVACGHLLPVGLWPISLKWQSAKIGPPSDMFSFAVVAWECVTMEKPWKDCTDVIQVFKTCTEWHSSLCPHANRAHNNMQNE